MLQQLVFVTLLGIGELCNAVVTAMMRMCDMYMQRALESPLTQLTVNQAAGPAGCSRLCSKLYCHGSLLSTRLQLFAAQRNRHA
jgi:hypothetical protein